jgi:hypothetical protein
MRKGRRAGLALGNTVSRWPRSSTCPGSLRPPAAGSRAPRNNRRSGPRRRGHRDPEALPQCACSTSPTASAHRLVVGAAIDDRPGAEGARACRPRAAKPREDVGFPRGERSWTELLKAAERRQGRRRSSRLGTVSYASPPTSGGQRLARRAASKTRDRRARPGPSPDRSSGAHGDHVEQFLVLRVGHPLARAAAVWNGRSRQQALATETAT